MTWPLPVVQVCVTLVEVLADVLLTMTSLKLLIARWRMPLTSLLMNCLVPQSGTTMSTSGARPRTAAEPAALDP